MTDLECDKNADGLVQDCSFSIGNGQKLLQFWAKLLMQ